jgi:hypothetical protein
MPTTRSSLPHSLTLVVARINFLLPFLSVVLAHYYLLPCTHSLTPSLSHVCPGSRHCLRAALLHHHGQQPLRTGQPLRECRNSPTHSLTHSLNTCMPALIHQNSPPHLPTLHTNSPRVLAATRFHADLRGPGDPGTRGHHRQVLLARKSTAQHPRVHHGRAGE